MRTAQRTSQLLFSALLLTAIAAGPARAQKIDWNIDLDEELKEPVDPILYWLSMGAEGEMLPPPDDAPQSAGVIQATMTKDVLTVEDTDDGHRIEIRPLPQQGMIEVLVFDRGFEIFRKHTF